MNTTLPTFNGRPESNVNEWLYSCKRFLEYSNNDEGRRVGLASSYLRNIASQDYILHEQTHGKHWAWSEFESYMRKKYTPANPEQIDDANNNNGPTRNDDQPLADNPATTDQIDGANNNSSTIPDDAEPNNPSKLTPSEIEAILNNPRKNQNLESMAAWLNYYS
jgi:hypothetical protein